MSSFYTTQTPIDIFYYLSYLSENKKEAVLLIDKLSKF